MGPFTAEARRVWCLGRDGAGGQPAGLHLYPRCKGYDVPTCGLAASIAVGGVCPGREPSGHPEGRCPRAVITGGTRRHVGRSLRVGGWKAYIAVNARGDSFQTDPLPCVTLDQLARWACPSVKEDPLGSSPGGFNLVLREVDRDGDGDRRREKVSRLGNSFFPVRQLGNSR